MKTLNETADGYPKRIISDSYRSDMLGDAIDYEGDKLMGRFTRTEDVVNSWSEEVDYYERSANPDVFTEITVLPI
tara:strand:- start:262 stop:486 length:225 start_codon:yes stop_codon:yes gene_type:complete